MFKPFVFIIATVLASTAQAAPEINALLTHESINHRADGVTETYVYQERLVRADDNVWLERVLPPQNLPTQPGTAGDHGPNLQTLPRWMRKANAGSATLTLVDRATRIVVAVKPPEFGRLGYSDNWLAESSLIDPAGLKTMQLSARVSTQVSTHWYEPTRTGRYSRILWSDALQFPLAIETGSEDGRVSSRTTVALSDAPKTRPWSGLEGYAAHEVDDFGD